MMWREKFESGVNPEGIQTFNFIDVENLWFESGVNPEGIQTKHFHLM